MQAFHKVLLVSDGTGEPTDVAARAVAVAHAYGASLEALIIHPELPAEMEPHRKRYETTLRNTLKEAVDAAATGLAVDSPPLTVTLSWGAMAAQQAIRHVLRGDVDLLIKAAGAPAAGPGFRSVDMELLRKCPCPVWLLRPPIPPLKGAHVAVAVDVLSPSEAERDLSLRLLQLGRRLADSGDGVLDVISCWDYEFENYLRNSAWAPVPEDQVLRAVMNAEASHRSAVDDCLRAAGIGARVELCTRRGQPREVIADVAREREVDTLVMGSLGRTGIPGFVIGNTAEDVMQRVECSLLAMKPAGFVSPVKAFQD